MNLRDAGIRGPVILRRLYCKIVCRLVPCILVLSDFLHWFQQNQFFQSETVHAIDFFSDWCYVSSEFVLPLLKS